MIQYIEQLTETNSDTDCGTTKCRPNEIEFFLSHPYQENDTEELDFECFEKVIQYLEDQYLGDYK